MIERVIRGCIENRALVLLLSAALVLAGVWAVRTITVDAIPDLSDVQVIIRTEFPGQAPQIVEDQVTYPLTTAMLAVPRAETVRGFSMFGSSFVYIIFDDGTDLYWARSRVLEQLSTVAARLPEGVAPQLGPDATGVGWVYEYALVTGRWCPDHPDGLWHDPESDEWFETRDGAKDDEQRARLERRRAFLDVDRRFVDPETGRSFAAPDLAPPASRARLVELESAIPIETCPLDGTPLREPEASIADLRSIQDWHLRPELTAVEGVSEVATVGGMVRQYQVILDPVALLAHDLGIDDVKRAIARSNQDVGGRVLEHAETEFMVRSLGYLGSALEPEGESSDRVVEDLEQVVLRVAPGGVPVTVRDIGRVVIGPEIRRGIAEWNGDGETVGGIVVMRSGENARDTIERVRARLDELADSLPPGVDIVTAYDRSDLIDRAISTLTKTLIEEIIVVSLVVLLFLLHVRSALVAVIVLPTGVLGALLLMRILGIDANIMSLGGIAIAIGVMVDSAIIMVENAHKALEEERRRVSEGAEPRPRAAVIAEAASEVGPSLFFSLLVITVSFIPVFVLTGQSGRLFSPLAYTKTFAMGVAAVLSITLIPVAMVWFIRGRIVPEERNPVSRALQALYDPVFALAMRFRVPVIIGSLALLALTIVPAMRIGSEFMPPLEEGDFLYMPNTDPGLSVTKARELLQQTDALIALFPEVRTVFGKVGRADTATDPAPLTMIETTVTLERDKSKWRQVEVPVLGGLFHRTRPITIEELTDGYALPNGEWVPGINEVLRLPGLSGALTRGAMPIRTRIDMLATGIRTPVGVKVLGPDLATLSAITSEIESVLRTDPEISVWTSSVAADRTVGGHYVDIEVDRDAIRRHGLHVAEVQEAILTAVGGMTVTRTVEGLERYPVNIRYARELREVREELGDVLVRAPTGAHVPLAQLARIVERTGPPMIKSEDARPTSWLYVTPHIADLAGYVARAKRVVEERVELPPGYSIRWSGQFEYIEEANARLRVAVPLAGLVIVLLLYAATKSWIRTGIVLLAVPFSAIGAIWLLHALDYEFSVAVWVGIIALAGLDAETGLVMLHYLKSSCDKFARAGRLRTRDDLWWAIHDGAVQRIRPKTMTVCTTFIGLLPLMFASGAGADTMRRLAAPMIGGLATSFIAELVIYPVLWYLVQVRSLSRGGDA